MTRRVLEAWLLLLYADCLMRFRGFRRVHAVVRNRRVNSIAGPLETDTELSRAVDLACVFYFKRALCLQRSAALAILLRRHGCDGDLVIGAQLFPFQSHAWVEAHGRVVNDKAYVQEVFQVLERC
jgi:hypothetical protein